MFSVFVNAWKVNDLRKKLLYTLFMLAVIRLLAHIMIPGLNPALVDEIMQTSSGNVNTLYSIISGGAFSYYSVFAMGVGPYITSSIIMQLLTIAIPKLEQMQKEGEAGRKKIQNITRYLTVALSFIQAAGLTYNFYGSGVFLHNNFLVYIVSIVSLMTGTVLAMWMGEQITKIGLGNGTSLIIFINIVSSLPSAVSGLAQTVSAQGAAGAAKVITLLVVFTFIIAFVVLAQVGERRLPVQYSKKMAGRTMVGGGSTFIPIKVNTSGVISIIFAISLIQFPQTISGFIPAASRPGFLTTLVNWLDIKHPVGALLYILLIIAFTYFYTSIVINPTEMAENMKKNGGFIPGIRPGKPTSDFIVRVLDRITFVGAIFYAAIALIPVILGWVFNMDNVGFGGTTLLIVVGVALETVKQIEAQLLMRHYKGFLKG